MIVIYSFIILIQSFLFNDTAVEIEIEQISGRTKRLQNEINRTVYGLNDPLPAEIYKSVQSVSIRLQKKKLLEALLTRLAELDIDYMLVFGSLLATIRNGILVLPWDDDIDIAINQDVIYQLTDGLEEISGPVRYCKDTWYRNGWFTLTFYGKQCRKWRLSSNDHKSIIIVWKDTGVSWKIYEYDSEKDKRSVPIDIYEFVDKDGRVSINPKMLRGGHVTEFDFARELIFPWRTISVPFSGEAAPGKAASLGELFELSIPSDPFAILNQTYGSDALKICKSSQLHRNTLEFQKADFPCSNLPERFFQPQTLSI